MHVCAQPPNTVKGLQVLVMDIAKKRSHITLGRKSYAVLVRLVNQPERVATQSITELAQWMGTSPSTLSRLSIRLGYRGFSDFQSVFNRAIVGAHRLFYAEKAHELMQLALPTTEAPSRALMMQLALETVGNMNDLLRQLDEAQLARVAKQLAMSRAIRVYGLRQMHAISSFMTYGLSMLRTNVAMLTGPGSGVAESLSQMGHGDILMVVSVAPYTKMTIKVAQAATQMGIHVIALTDTVGSPLVAHAAEAFLIPHQSSFISNSIGTYIVFCEGLLNLVATELGDQAIHTLQQREQSIHQLDIETD
ncbi:MAG: MurR/RpiR family transcriptional regulator [Neisseriaceae bacterium]|nr:MurR/RpiR family transcriptional regulator [Neisseriaceae bacterium]